MTDRDRERHGGHRRRRSKRPEHRGRPEHRDRPLVAQTYHPSPTGRRGSSIGSPPPLQPPRRPSGSRGGALRDAFSQGRSDNQLRGPIDALQPGPGNPLRRYMPPEGVPPGCEEGWRQDPSHPGIPGLPGQWPDHYRPQMTADGPGPSRSGGFRGTQRSNWGAVTGRDPDFNNWPDELREATGIDRAARTVRRVADLATGAVQSARNRTASVPLPPPAPTPPRRAGSGGVPVALLPSEASAPRDRSGRHRHEGHRSGGERSGRRRSERR